jgi:TadE-like protein
MRSTSSGGSSRARGERGATVVEFLAVTILTVACLLGIAQLAVWVWARNVALTAVHEGARTAAETGRPLRDGARRTRDVLDDGLGAGSGRFLVDVAEQDGTVAVRARGDAPTIVPFMPAFPVDVRADAFDEDRVLR